MTHSRVAAVLGSRRRQSARGPRVLTGLSVALVLGACEQPVRPAPGPAPLEAAAAQLNVPAATVHELASTAARLAVPPTSGATTDPSSEEAQRLRQIMQRLEQDHQSAAQRIP